MKLNKHPPNSSDISPNGLFLFPSRWPNSVHRSWTRLRRQLNCTKTYVQNCSWSSGASTPKISSTECGSVYIVMGNTFENRSIKIYVSIDVWYVRHTTFKLDFVSPNVTCACSRQLSVFFFVFVFWLFCIFSISLCRTGMWEYSRI